MAPRLPILAVFAATLPACFPTDEGAQPPLDGFYFPVGVELGAGGDRLYVANSDFDLAYNQGTLMALDARALRRHLPIPCQSDADCASGACDLEGTDARGPSYLCIEGGSVCPDTAEQSARDRAEVPGLCGPLPLSASLIKATVRIAPFVTDLEHVRFLDDSGQPRARLLLPVRGDATLHWADVETAPGEGPVLDCGQGRGHDCDADHRRGDSATESSSGIPDLTLPTEPFAVAVTDDGRAALVAHQVRGELSLFSNADDGPRLQFVLDDLPPGLRGIARVPAPRWAEVADVEHRPGFLTTFRHQSGLPTVELVRYYDDEAAGDVGPFLQLAGGVRITPASNGMDSRGIAVDDSQRLSCEAECGAVQSCAGDEASNSPCECLVACAAVPLHVYIANRSPSSLLSGSTQPLVGHEFQDDLAHLNDMEPMRGGPSHVYVGNVIGDDGEPALRVFVVAFDSQLLYIYDPQRRSIEARITTGRGPHALAVDEAHGLAYIAHFSDSNIGVLDLDRRHASYGTYLLVVGEPVPLESAQ